MSVCGRLDDFYCNGLRKGVSDWERNRLEKL